jgi:hypothetical protein
MHYLYETPWWLPAGIAAVGVVLFMVGTSKGEKRLRLAGAGVVALAVLLIGLSWALKSEREIVEERTRGMLTAIEKRDWQTFRGYLHPKIVVVGSVQGPERVAGAVEAAVRLFDIDSLRVSALDAVVEGETIQVSVQVVAHGKNTMQPTGWQLDWRKDQTGQWTLFDVDARDAPGFDASWARNRSWMVRP